MGGLNRRNAFSHSSGGWKAEIKVWAGLGSAEASLLGLQMAALLLPLRMVILLCTCIPGVSVYQSSSYKDTSYKDSQIGLGLILMASF